MELCRNHEIKKKKKWNFIWMLSLWTKACLHSPFVAAMLELDAKGAD